MSCSRLIIFKPNLLAAPLGRPLFFIVRFLPRLFAFLAVAFFFFLAPCMLCMCQANGPGLVNVLAHFLHLNVFLGIKNLLSRTTYLDRPVHSSNCEYPLSISRPPASHGVGTGIDGTIENRHREANI